MKNLLLIPPLLLQLINTVLTPIELIKQELHKTHKKINNIYIDLMIQLSKEEENKKDACNVIENIAFRLEWEANEYEIANLILEKCLEIDYDELISAKVDELGCVEKELSGFVDDQVSISKCYSGFVDKVRDLDLFEMFDCCLNEYVETCCGVGTIQLKNRYYVLKRLRLAVEEQIRRLEYLRTEIEILKNN